MERPHPEFFDGDSNVLKVFSVSTVSELIIALQNFHPNALVAVTIPENAEPGHIYLVRGTDAGWDSEKMGTSPIDIILEDNPSSC